MARQGTDGARGEYMNFAGPSNDSHKLSNGDVAGYSMALAELLDPTPLVIVGRDTRPFGHELTRYATAGVEAAGGRVIDVGIAPTPAIQKIAVDLGAAGAISLTPSHNPHTDAGWKGMFGAEKPSKDQIHAIDEHFGRIVAAGLLDLLRPSVYDREKHERTYHLGNYMRGVVSRIQQSFDNEYPLDGKIVVVDTARGAANNVTPWIFEHLGAQVVRFACDTNGLVNHNCGATHLGGLRQFLRERPELISDARFLGAVANDGDADRFMGLGATVGNEAPRFSVLDGNITLELKAKQLAETQGAPGETGVVSTEYVNPATVRRISAMGLEFAMCQNGDVNVTKTLRERGWIVGAEPSGHIVDLRLGIPSGDGVQNAAEAAVFAALNGTTFWDITREHRLDPDYQITIPLPQGVAYDEHGVRPVLERTRKDETNQTVITLRPSGTEPIIRARVSGIDPRQTYKRVDGLARAAKRVHESTAV
jgi:phosphoglucosamine mutase